MARSFAAIASVRAHSIHGLVRSFVNPAYVKLLDIEPWLRRIVPVMVGLFVVALGSVSFMNASATREETLVDAANDIDILAAYAASEFGRVATDAARAAPAKALGFIPGHVLHDG